MYATQNISNFYGQMPTKDSSGRSHVESLLGNLQNRFFCQNLQHETNLWASESIGKVVIRRINAGTGASSSATSAVSGGSTSTSSNYNQGWAEQLDYDVQPRAFTGLRRGGLKRKKRPEDNDDNEEAENTEATAQQNASPNGTAPKKKSEEKRGQSEAIVVIAGRRFEANGERWLRVLFEQFAEIPPWVALSTERPWACIVSGKTKRTWLSSFLENVPLTPRGLWKAYRLWANSRKAEADGQ